VIKPPKFLQNIFSTQYMVRDDQRLGTITPSKEAYSESLKIAIPGMAEMVSIALMGMIDTVMVGRVGSSAVAAVGLTQQPRMIMLSVFMAMNIAMTAIVARSKGAGDMNKAKSALRHAIMIGLGLGLLLTVLGVVFAEPLLYLAGAQYDTIGPSSMYFRITSFALIFQVLTATICAAQRACGNTKITMRVNVTAKIISVCLNFLLIEGRFGFPRLEVEGAAISTVIATGIAFCLALASVIRKDSVLRISWLDSWKFELPMLKSMGRLASGGIAEQLALRVGFFLYARVVAGLGTDEFAAHIIVQQLMILSFTFADGIGAATTALVGQNLGKKRPDLSIMYGKIGMRLAWCVSAMLALTVFLIRNRFPVLFTNEPHIIAAASGVIMVLAIVMPIQTSQLVMGGSLRGAGDTRFVALTMLITVGIIRPVMGFLFTWTLGFGLIGAWIAIIFDQGLRLILLFRRFSGGKWIKAKV